MNLSLPGTKLGQNDLILNLYGWFVVDPQVWSEGNTLVSWYLQPYHTSISVFQRGVS